MINEVAAQGRANRQYVIQKEGGFLQVREPQKPQADESSSFLFFTGISGVQALTENMSANLVTHLTASLMRKLRLEWKANHAHQNSHSQLDIR